MKLSIFQCQVCHKAWPLKSVPRNAHNYIFNRCSRDKNTVRKFSKEYLLIPSPVPHQLEGSTQTEQMLLARALPIMTVYIKPGGQRGYSGHYVNMPQNVKELARALPCYPKDVSVILVHMKGKNSTFKDILVLRQKVLHALQWLIAYNPCCKELSIDYHALSFLPENGIPEDIMALQTTQSEGDGNECIDDRGPCSDDEDLVYNEDTEMSSFLPIPETETRQADIFQQQLENATIDSPSIGEQPLNEFTTPFLAAMAFPTLFPDGKGDPTNPSLYRSLW